MFFTQYPYINENDLNLDYILKHLKEFMLEVEKLDAWKSVHEQEYLQLKKLYDDIIEGHFPGKMKESLYKWIVDNSKSILAEIVKIAFFALENGYLVTYIPNSWSDIIFGTTGLDDFIGGYDFGHLTLTY